MAGSFDISAFQQMLNLSVGCAMDETFNTSFMASGTLF